MKPFPLLAVIGPLAVIAACDNPAPEPRGNFPIASMAVGSRVAFVDQASATVFVIDPAERELRARLQPVGENPLRALVRPGHDEVLVLSTGVRDEAGRTAEPGALTVVPTEAGKSPRRHLLDTRFTDLAVSPDGRFAVLHFAPESAQAAASLVVNPNEIAVLDLDAPMAGADAAPSRGLRSYGGVPRQVVFSPPLALHTDTGARMLRLAVVLSDNYVTLVDLENDRSEITVSLTRADEPRVVRPLQVLFEPGNASNDPTLFIRSDGSSDIVALRLVASPPPRPDRSNDFRPVLSLLGSGSRPGDLAIYQASEGLRLLMVAPDAGEASVIDPRTSRVTTFRLDARAEQIVLFEGASPAEPERRPRALLLASGGGQVGFLDLDRLEDLQARNLELRPMARVERFLPMVERGVVLASHGAQRASGAGLSIIDLHRRTVSPLFSESMQDLQPGPTPTDELWLLPTSDSRLGRLSLAHLTTTEVRLDLPASRVLPLAASAGGARFVVVEHGPGGTITVLDADKPERQTARSLVGFMWTNLLERRKP